MGIKKIRKEIVYCDLNCEGINKNIKKGIIPRGLYLQKRKGKHKCIVVGINPGKCRKKQKDFFLENIKFLDKAAQKYFDKYSTNVPYFKKARDLISILGYDGDILWTNLAKCECLGKNGILPIQTLRICINKYLKKEIKSFKVGVIFALGNDAFQFCSLSFPEHFIIGLPHPTGSYGNFYKLKKEILKNKNYYKKLLLKKKDKKGYYIALHLSKV